MGGQGKLPPLKAIHAFTRAAHHLNFGKAAEELCVTTAAVSYQVRLLERSLGSSLFYRLPRGLELTREGMTLQSVCQKALSDIGDVVETFRSGSEQLAVRVASVPHFSARVLFPARQEFMRRFPLYNLILEHTLGTPDFSEDEYDFAVLWGKGGWLKLESDLLFNSTTAPACAPSVLDGHPMASINDLIKVPILLDHTSFHRMWVDWFHQSGAEGWEKLRFVPCNDIHALLLAASEGYGIVMEPDFVIADMLSAGVLVRPFETVMSDYGYHLVYPADTLRKPACRTFRDWLLAHISELHLNSYAAE